MAVSSPLTRLNFFDGLFLRAELLRREQDGLRSLVFQSNRADGAGLAFGLEASVEGDTIAVRPGLAIDGHGRVVLLAERATASLSELLGLGGVPRRPPLTGSERFEDCVELPPHEEGGVASGTALYAIVVRHAESACGWEEVRGRACEDACDAAMERPYVVESARIGLCPVSLLRPRPQSQAVVLTDRHLRSQIAASYFADEQDRAGSLISNAGLRTDVWCRGAVETEGICGEDVPVALIAVRGTTPVFLDPWIVRRERIQAPPHRYWAGRMRMRPWDVFLAQVLQFQCQLAEMLGGPRAAPPLPVDLCGDTRSLLGETLTVLDALGDEPVEEERRRRFEFDLASIGGPEGLGELRRRVRDVLRAEQGAARILVDGGIVELPPAGWLPVDPHSDVALTRQVADLFGAGVDLRFCAVRADQAAEELESCQHLDRLSLLRGLDDPADRERVDILVPDGELAAAGTAALFEIEVAVSPERVGIEIPDRAAVFARAVVNPARVPLRGAARVELSRAGPFAFYAALAGGVSSQASTEAAFTWAHNLVRGTAAPARFNMGTVTPTDARLRAVASRLLADAGPREAGALPTLAAVRNDGEPIFGWVELTADGNPFTAGEDNGGACALDTLWFTPVRPGRVLAIQFNGRYVVRDVLDNGVRVRVEGLARVQQDTEVHDSEAVSLDLALHLEDGRLRVEGDVRMQLQWGGSPIEARAEISSPNLPFAAAAELSQNAAVADTGNPYHERAMSALGALAVLRPAGDFVEASGAKLFATTTAPARIRTPHDWVLFRRRTRYECGDPQPVPVRDQRVQLWDAVVDTEDEANRIVEVLRGGDAERGWDVVGPVVFEATSARMRTTLDAIEHAWTLSRGGDKLWFAGYHAAGGAVHPAGRERARVIARALRRVAALARSEEDSFDVLHSPIAGAVPAGFEAAVFAVSLRPREVVRECAEIFDLKGSGDADAWVLVREPNVGRVEALIGELVNPRGEAVAEDGHWRVDEPFPVRPAVEVVVWARAEWLEANGPNRAGEAGQQVAEALGASNVDIQVLTAEFESRCPLRIFIRPVL